MNGEIDLLHRSDAGGFSLLETVFALSLMMIMAVGLLPLGTIAVTTTENQGHLMARTTEYAHDKLEQLLVLGYTDSTSDTRAFPATATGGTGLTVGGSSEPDTPVALYVDYLDIDGNLLASTGTTAPDGWFYKRVWSVSSPSTNLKQITVTAIVKTAAGTGSSGANLPRATVATLKDSHF